MELFQPKWSARPCHAVECCNVTIEGEDEDLRNINILKTDGHYEVEGPHIEIMDIIVLFKTRQVNIGSEVEPIFVKIEDYWDDATVLLCEY